VNIINSKAWAKLDSVHCESESFNISKSILSMTMRLILILFLASPRLGASLDKVAEDFSDTADTYGKPRNMKDDAEYGEETFDNEAGVTKRNLLAEDIVRELTVEANQV
jgi:hypothetical protein